MLYGMSIKPKSRYVCQKWPTIFYRGCMQCHYVQVSEFPQSDMNDANNNELHIQSTSSFALGHLQHRRTKNTSWKRPGVGLNGALKRKLLNSVSGQTVSGRYGEGQINPMRRDRKQKSGVASTSSHVVIMTSFSARSVSNSR